MRQRWYFEAARAPAAEDEDEDEDEGAEGDTYCIDLERHSHLVTPRPGMPLDGSMGVTAPREQTLVVLYHASGGEISAMWIAPDTADLGASEARDGIEKTELFVSFRQQVERLAGGKELQVHYNDYRQ